MIGQKISHYEIVQKLGAGGMGDIYKALDSRLNRSVAIKVLASTSGEGTGRRRFLQEAQAASALNHPNIITIHDIITQDNNEFMVMEFVAGKTLADLIPQSGLGVRDSLRYGVQIADALQAAHAVGIVHRDLKPGNVMVTDTGLVKVLDFGLAKFTNKDATAELNQVTVTHIDAPLTVKGSIIGTVSYMSPEQAQGKTVDHRSDIFSFGLLLYEMVTGRRAFNSDSAISTLTAILRDDVAPMVDMVRDMPPDFEQVIARCLRKSPDDRWPGMKDVQEALAALKQRSDSGTLSMPAVTAPPAKVAPAARKKSPTLAIAGAVALVAIAGAAGLIWKATHKPAAPVTEAVVTPPAPQNPEPAPPPVAAPPTAPAETPADTVLTNQNVLDMLEAKMSASLIISQIRSSKTKFNLSTPEVIRLAKAGVPEPVIEAMRNPTRAASVSGTPRPAAPAPVTSQPQGSTAAPAPAPTQPAPAVQPPPPPVSAEPAAPASHPVAVVDGLPFVVRLMQDVPSNPQAGQSLRFETTKDFRIGNAVVIAQGAAVTGAILDAGKKKFLGKEKPTYRMIQVTAVDGSRITIRATPSPREEGRSLEVPGRTMPKDLSAVAGTEFIAYITGAHTVSVATPR